MLPVLSLCGVLPSTAILVSEVYFLLYSELPVFEGILWAYFEGLGTSDTLTALLRGYSCREGRTHSCPAISVGFIRSGNVPDVQGWRCGSGMMRRHCGHLVAVGWGRGTERCSSWWAWGW